MRILNNPNSTTKNIQISKNTTKPLNNNQTVKLVELSNTTEIVKPGFEHYGSLISFSGLYEPTKLKRSELYNGLKGVFKVEGKLGVGPDYFANEDVIKSLKEFITNEEPPKFEIKNELTNLKTYASNFRAFLTGKDLKTINEYSKETDFFLDSLQSQVKLLNKTAKDVGLSKEETAFLHNFIAETAPTLYSMGFNDAIPHSIQVARKCMVENFQQGGKSTEVLQAGIIGLIHDPKFPANYSWDNLATHPIIAESIADRVFNKSSNRDMLFRILGKDNSKVNNFIKGVTETLPINNDSLFVNDKVILPKFSEEVKEIAKKRLEAPRQGSIPPQFPHNIRQQMQTVSLETGIKGLDIDKFKASLTELLQKYPDLKGNFWQAAMLGKFKNKAILTDFKSILEKNGAITSINVSGDNLFCHNQEVKHAPMAAKSLVLADQMLLSPHKIIMEGSKEENTVLKRIQSFCQSFSNNIMNISKESIDSAKKWQREIYISIIKSADELTGTHNLQKIENSTLPIDEQINSLHKIIKDENTWSSYANMEPSDSSKDLDIKKIIETIKRNYEATAESSKEMFSVN